jgi:hypothetical protein
MSKAGIKIIEETVGSGPMVTKTDRVQLVFDMQLRGGDYLIQDTSQKIDLADATLSPVCGMESKGCAKAERASSRPHHTSATAMTALPTAFQRTLLWSSQSRL